MSCVYEKIWGIDIGTGGKFTIKCIFNQNKATSRLSKPFVLQLM